jgi:hypothetical protein
VQSGGTSTALLAVYTLVASKYKIQGELSKVFNGRKLDIPPVSSTEEALINPFFFRQFDRSFN